MNKSNVRIALLCAGLAAPLLPAARSQTAPAAQPRDEAVVLPQFTITENPANPYQSQQALSASRVATAIQDIPQTISVIPRALIEDTMGDRMLDVAKYVTPITESTLPAGADRYTIRGFQVSHEFIDGTEISGQDGYSMSLAPYNIERIEIIKGPNAILVPGGSPGGQINPITKSPLAKDASSVTLELAEYMGNAVSFDVNRLINPKNNMAVRFVAAYWRNDSMYLKNQYRNGYMIAPSFAVQLSPDHKLTIKAEFLQNRETNLGGVPLDPAVGSNDYARIARGLPRNWSFGNDEDSRHRSTERVSAELLSNLGDHVTSRLYVMADHVLRVDVGGTGAGVANYGGGSRNPLTGLYEPGVNWNTAAYNADETGTVVLTGTPVPITDPSTWTYTRRNGKVYLNYDEAHIKNDYAAVFDTNLFKSTTIAGFAANTSKVHFKSYKAQERSAVANNNLDAITYERYVFPEPTAGLTTDDRGGNRTGKQNDLQVFVSETLSLFQDRLQLSGGVSRFFGELTRVDRTGTAVDPQLKDTAPSYNLSTNATSVGVVVKPIKEVSLFYSHNNTGASMPSSLNAGNIAPSLKVSQGGQDEFGVKTSFLDGTLTTSLAYFEIAQDNYPVTNSDYYLLIAQGKTAEAAALPPLYLDLTSKGWEFEATYSWNKNLTILGNVSSYKVRQPVTDVRLRGVPDHSAAVYVDYRFTDGALKGFGANIGVDYHSDSAGDNASGYISTTTNGVTTTVPNQPQFLIAGRTLANLGFSYRRDNWTVRLSITNVLDKDYIQAATSRGTVFVGEPRAWKVSTTYTF
jgi:iron complex outermembrane receptor protein